MVTSQVIEDLRIKIMVLEAENKGLRQRVKYLELRLQAMQDDNENKSFICGMSPRL